MLHGWKLVFLVDLEKIARAREIVRYGAMRAAGLQADRTADIKDQINQCLPNR